MQRWQLQDAKNKLSEVLEEALNHGPQLITKHGVEAVVVLSYVEYRRITVNQTKLSEFFRKSPLSEMDLDLSRDQSGLREDFSL